MKRFADTQGRQWAVVMNVETLRRVRDETGTDLMGVLSSNLLARLAEDLILLTDVLFAAVKPEADKESVTLAAFSANMDGETLEAGFDALMNELADFSPPRSRARLTTALGLMKEINRRSAALALEQLERIDPDDLLRQAQATAGGSSTNSPGSPDSTPAP